MKKPQNHHGLIKLALSIQATFRSRLQNPAMRRRAVAAVNARLADLVAAGEVQPGWTTVIIDTKAGADIQFARAS